MEVLHGLKASSSLSKKTIITIGNFDGVHLGHKKILQFLVQESQKYDLFSLVLTFSPHPDIILGKSKVKMIQTLDQRLKAIERFRIHGVLITPFNKEFSGLSSDEFIQKIVVSALKAEEVVIGENFQFGKNREGNINTFRALGAQLNFRVHEIPKVIKKGRTVSSSLIRALLQEGKIEEANILLERYGVYHAWEYLTQSILDHNKKGICPYEKLAAKILNPEEAYRKLKAFQNSLT